MMIRARRGCRRVILEETKPAGILFVRQSRARWPAAVVVPKLGRSVALSRGWKTDDITRSTGRPASLAATARTEARPGSVEVGMVSRTGRRPAAVASTTMSPSSSDNGFDPSDRIDRTRSRSERPAIEVTPTRARTRPWWAGWTASVWERLLLGSPLAVPRILPGPATTRKTTVWSAKTSVWFVAESTIVPRIRAASEPSRSRAEPVPVRGDGQSRVSARETSGWGRLVSRAVRASSVPPRDRATAVIRPGFQGIARHSP
mmetsp:Transcript_16258/g.37639  ORF Transcript_16258/g.37639 Transcript_16258/m.37639 type:complete len:260 (-) Transcript_16258:924-1703(-)